MRIKRIPDSVTPTSATAEDPEVQVSDAGYCWRKLGQRYIGEGFLQRPGGKLIDVSGFPLHTQGSPGDAALCPDSRCWIKNDAGEWIFEDFMIAPEIEDLLVNGFRVDGNLSLPMVDGKIPIYDRRGIRIGNLTWDPVNEDESE